MDKQTASTIRACAAASAEGRLQFGEVVKVMMDAGVERYVVDFIRSDATYYMPNGDFDVIALHHPENAPAVTFSAAGIVSAIRGAQAGTLGYPAFCTEVIAAGCVGYVASMAARRVVYYGRTGDNHVELFPGTE